MQPQDNFATWLPLKTLRLLALLALIGITMWQCVQNIQDYLNHEAVTTVSKESHDSIEFPQVTICNYNRWRYSLISPEEFQMAIEAYNKAYDQAHVQESVSSNAATKDLYNFTYEKGWHLVDQYSYNSLTVLRPKTLIRCTFSGRSCSTKFFKHRMTSYGNCYTFNKDLTPFEINATDISLPLAQTHASENSGFDALIDIETSEYSEIISTNGSPLLGIKVIVHSKDEQPDPTTSGVSIGPGFYGTIAVQRTEYNNLPPPEGACNPQRVLQHFDTYTISACETECKMTQVEQNCSCRPYFYPRSSTTCSLDDTIGCSYRIIDKINQNFSKYCDCPEPCTYEKFTTSVSYAPYPSYSYGYSLLRSMKEPEEAINLLQFQTNYVGLKVYLTDIGSTVITQSPAHTLVSTLNDLGGTSGLYIGFSFVTLIELIEVIADLIQTKMMKKNSVENMNNTVQGIQKEAFK